MKRFNPKERSSRRKLQFWCWASRVFDVPSWKAEHEFAPASDVYTPAFSPDNRRLALSFVTQTQIWDVADSRTLADISPPFGGRCRSPSQEIADGCHC